MIAVAVLEYLNLQVKLLDFGCFLLVLLLTVLELVGELLHFYLFPLAVAVVLLRQALEVLLGLHKVGLQLF